MANARSLLEIIFQTKKQGTGAKDSEKELKNLDQTTKQVVGSYTEMLSVLSLAEQGFTAAKEIYKQTVGAAMEYAFQVDDVSRATGMNSEESSRWIQIAGDMRIEYDQLKTAMQVAIRQGVDPSIEGMQRLADEYNQIQDPIEKSRFLLQNFGREGLIMGRILEQGGEGIEELNQGISKGLILTPEAIQQTKDFYNSMDNFGDSVDAAKIALGQRLIPILDLYITMMNAAIDIQNADINTLEAVAEKAYNAVPALRLLSEAWVVNNEMALQGASALDRANFWAMKIGETIATTLIPGVFDSKLTWEEMNAAMGNTIETQKTWTEEQLKAAEETSYYIERGDELVRVIYGSAEALRYGAEPWNSYTASLEAARIKAEQMEEANRNLIPAIDAVTAAEERFAESLGEKVGQELDKFLSEDSKKYEEALKVIDEVSGTSLSTQDELGDGVNELAKEYAQGKIDIDEFRTRLKELQDQFTPFDDAVIESKKNVKELYDQWGELAKLPKEYNIWVYTHWVDLGNKPMTSNYEGAGSGRRQFGGSMKMGSPYWVGEQGAELFVPSRGGQMLTKREAMAGLSGNGEGGMTFNNTQFLFTPAPGRSGEKSFEDFYNFLSRRARESKLSGAITVGQ